MRALVWIIEDTWEATVADAAEFLPSGADITLLHVASTETETVARAARRGLLGRHPPQDAEPQPLPAISERAAHELLAEAQTLLGRPARLEARRGRVKHEVVAAAESMDILVLARDGGIERRDAVLRRRVHDVPAGACAVRRRGPRPVGGAGVEGGVAREGVPQIGRAH